SIYVELRNCRPVAVTLNFLAQFGVGEYIGGPKWRTQLLENLHGRRRESALWKTSGTFHEDLNLVAADRGMDSRNCLGQWSLPPIFVLRGREGPQRECMHPHSHRIAKCFVHRLMPLDEALAFEHRTHDQRVEMVSATGGVSDLDVSIRNSLPDQTLNFLRIHSRLFNRLPWRDSTPERPARISAVLRCLWNCRLRCLWNLSGRHPSSDPWRFRSARRAFRLP